MKRLAGFLLFACACCVALATTLQQLSVDQMTQSATAIVRARVIGSSAGFTGSTIYTHYKLAISETLKGAPGNEVMLPGGVSGGFRQSFPGVPTLETGAEYVLFLWTSEKGITYLIGFSQGMFSVNAQPDGSVQLSRPQIGETMLDSGGRPVQDHPVRMNLADLKVRIRGTL